MKQTQFRNTISFNIEAVMLQKTDLLKCFHYFYENCVQKTHLQKKWFILCFIYKKADFEEVCSKVRL